MEAKENMEKEIEIERAKASEKEIAEKSEKSRLERVREAYPKADIGLIQSLDPSNNYKFVMWIANQIDRGHTPEDIRPTLMLFQISQDRLNKDQRDIQTYEDLKDLEDRLKDLGVSKRSKSSISKENAVHLGTCNIAKDLYKIIRVDDKEAAGFYGRDTRWCITMQNAEYFEQYQEKNNFFYFLIRENENENEGEKDKSKLALVIEKELSYKDVEVLDSKGNPVNDCREISAACEEDCGWVQLGQDRPTGRVLVNDGSETDGYKFYRIDNESMPKSNFRYEACRINVENNDRDVLTVNMKRIQTLKLSLWDTQDHRFEPGPEYDGVISFCKENCNNVGNTFHYNLAHGHLPRDIFLFEWPNLKKQYDITDDGDGRVDPG